MRIAAAIRTNSRLRRLALTSVLNTGRALTDLAQQFGTLCDDTGALADAGQDDDALPVERPKPHRTGHEAFCRNVLKDDVFTVGGANNTARRENDPRLGPRLLQDHRHRGTDLQRWRYPCDAQLHWHGLLPQGEAATDELERQRLAVGRRGHCRADVDNVRRIVGESLDPQLRRVNDLEQDLAAIDELTTDDVGD